MKSFAEMTPEEQQEWYKIIVEMSNAIFKKTMEDCAESIMEDCAESIVELDDTYEEC